MPLIYNSLKCNVVDLVCLLRAIRHPIITTGPSSAAACYLIRQDNERREERRGDGNNAFPGISREM